jgi:hypothetical protein
LNPICAFTTANPTAQLSMLCSTWRLLISQVSCPTSATGFLSPEFPQGLDRREPKNRNIWVVVQRMFNPRDMENGVALIVEDRVPTPAEYDLLPSN